MENADNMGADNANIMEHAVVSADGVDSKASENVASQQDTILNDAMEYFTVKNNCHEYHSIEPIDPYNIAWDSLQSHNSMEYCGDTYQVGGVIKVLVSGAEEDSITKIREIKSLDNGRYVLQILWYHREEIRFAGRRNICNWPTGNTHMRTTYVEVVMWDTVNGKVSAEQLDKLCPGKIFDLSRKSVRNKTHKLVVWASSLG
jgi:hypothetical protein